MDYTIYMVKQQREQLMKAGEFVRWTSEEDGETFIQNAKVIQVLDDRLEILLEQDADFDGDMGLVVMMDEGTFEQVDRPASWPC